MNKKLVRGLLLALLVVSMPGCKTLAGASIGSLIEFAATGNFTGRGAAGGAAVGAYLDYRDYYNNRDYQMSNQQQPPYQQPQQYQQYQNKGWSEGQEAAFLKGQAKWKKDQARLSKKRQKNLEKEAEEWGYQNPYR